MLPTITSAGGLTNQATQTVTGTADAGTTVSVFDNDSSTALASALVDADGVWTLSVTLSAQGSNSLTALSDDGFGTINGPSVATVYTLDATTPAAPSIDGLGGLTNQAAQLVAGLADPDASITLYDNTDTTPLGTAVADGDGIWTMSVTLNEGANSLTATATDAAGNVSAASDPSVYTLDTIAPALPTITSPGGLTEQSAQRVSGTAQAGSVVSLYDNAETDPLGTVLADADGNWTVDISLNEGTNSLTAQATDPAGNTSEASSASVYTLDTTALSAPTITSLGGLINQPTQTIVGTAIAGSTVDLYDNAGTASLGTTMTDGEGNWTVDITLTEGANSLVATATDSAGSVSAASAASAYTLDTQAPEVPAITSPGMFTNHDGQTLAGTAEAGSTVTLYDNTDTTPLGTALTDANGSWTIDVSLQDGVNSLTATATDPAGNVSAASTPVEYSVNTAIDDPNIDPVTHEELPTIDPTSDGSFAVTNVTLGISGGNMGDAYSGPVTSLAHQFIWTGTQGVAVVARVANTFLHGGAGDDALQVSSGSNVLDGGQGSNFLVGSNANDGGVDTFFVDARSAAPTWTTLVNFHIGDKAAIWGFVGDPASLAAFQVDGAANYTGATMRAQVNGHDSSLTFAGMTTDQATSGLTLETGSVGGNNYLLITRVA